MFGERSYDPRHPITKGDRPSSRPITRTRVAEGEQPESPFYSLSGAAKLAGAAGAIGAAGFLPYKGGRLWDQYLSAIRAGESLSPGGILRTFRTSEFLSAFGSATNVDLPSGQFRYAGKYREHLKNIYGATTEDIGYRARGKFSIFGDVYAEGKRVGIGMQVQAGTQTGASIADYYARVYGLDLGMYDSLSKDYLRSIYTIEQPELPFEQWLESLKPKEKFPRVVVGAKLRSNVSLFGRTFSFSEGTQVRIAQAETLVNFARAKSASSVGRLNVLLAKPFDVPVVGDILNKIPLIKNISVKPGTSLQMAGRFTKKALGIGMAWKGLQYYDYLRSEDDPRATLGGTVGGALAGGRIFRQPGTKFGKVGALAGAAAGLYVGLSERFDKGLFSGLASYYTDATILQARASEATGVREALERQEAITPGLISPKTGLAMGTLALMGVGMASYGNTIMQGISQRFGANATGGTLSDILESVRATKKASSIWDTALGSKIASKGPGKLLSKIKSPAGLAFIGGVALWAGLSTAAAVASGNPLAALPGASLLGTSETEEELQRIYSGEKLIPVRKGRWWEAGRTPYEGGKVDYYRPHFIARLDKRAYQKGIWGTEKEKWEHDPLLHPLKAMFGDDDWKYYYEKKYQDERPAPVTGTYFEDVPFFGPALAATVGKLFKPRKYIRKEEWMLPGGEGDGGGKFLDRPDRPELEPVKELGGLERGAPVDPDDPTQLLNELIYRRREGIGLVGFAEGAIQKAITGREEFFQNKRKMATMGGETGSEYWLWKHLNLGGGLFTTEPIRRFVPRTPSYLETYNPLKNTQASWLPDDYFIDLKHGNPFDKISEAEIRLPGAGYAAFHEELEGVSAEDYPIAHRVKILGDVAMWSDAYKKELKRAKEIRHMLSEKDQRIIRETEEQVREKKKRREFKNYKFANDQLETMNATVRKVISPNRFLTEEYGDAILELQDVGDVTDRAGAMGLAEERFLGKTMQFHVPAMEARRYDITKAGARIKAVSMFGDKSFGAMLEERKLATNSELSDEFERLNFTGRERAVGEMSEKFLHSLESPIEYLTPLAPTSKLVRQRSALEDYIATQAVGTQNAFWDRPIENFITPATAMAKHKMGIEETPDYIQERRDISQYFDMLEWVKAKKLETLALASGDVDEAKKYTRERKSTLFGLNPYGSPSAIMKALPSAERDYYQEFANVRTTAEQKEILQHLPENEKSLYMAKWMDAAAEAAEAKKAMRAATKEDEQLVVANNMLRRSEGLMYNKEQEDEWYEQTGGKQRFAEWLRDRKAEEYFDSHSLPGADWLGWHPSVDMDDVKMKYAESEGLDYHDFGLWDQRERMLARKPYVNSRLIRDMNAKADLGEVLAGETVTKQLGKMYDPRNSTSSVTRLTAGGNSEYNINIRDERKKLVEEARNKVGA